ncbi:cytochrome P450 94A1-like [Rhodamnia argentea]|uniref:Cytochrome P450 94A1-like n=1 Tax=Rhodamnia argentea TaxID=178133 RepID=A0A8B8QFS2_9MYRT|nr:cytochrome P450 94A1-like [Rhodamnia argentea]XP_048138975.1 cytochrome P450 94A1-like [Rhodamnia argentea]
MISSFFSTMSCFDLFSSFSHFIVLPSLLIVIGAVVVFFRSRPPSSSKNLPRVYPIFGSYFAIFANMKRRIDWTADLVGNSLSATYVLHLPLGGRRVFTGNPANVQHVLKTHFGKYEKGGVFKTVLRDVLGDGIFNTDGESWKFQRQVASHEFNTRSLRKFIENVVDAELNERLLPLLAFAAKSREVIDMQDILQRFAFDNICKIAFGYDAEYLSPSLPLPRAKFAEAFEDAVRISSERFQELFSAIWRVKRFFNLGSEKHLRVAISEVREFAKKIVGEKKRELSEKSSPESAGEDLLSRFLSSGHADEDFVIDIVISFILAGRDTTSAALTWYFWLLHKNPEVEAKVQGEIMEKSDAHTTGYDDVKEMVYTHASLCESMRFYPPVPLDTKEAVSDDVLEDGTVVKKGTRVTYHPYAMGRLEQIWGKDWSEFRPERWLRGAEDGSEKWAFVNKDAYAYPVFQAGPRVCLGKEMAFLQMKRVLAGVLQRFRVVPAAEGGEEPLFISYLSSKMEGGFPVRIEVRE